MFKAAAHVDVKGPFLSQSHRWYRAAGQSISSSSQCCAICEQTLWQRKETCLSMMGVFFSENAVVFKDLLQWTVMSCSAQRDTSTCFSQYWVTSAQKQGRFGILVLSEHKMCGDLLTGLLGCFVPHFLGCSSFTPFSSLLLSSPHLSSPLPLVNCCPLFLPCRQSPPIEEECVFLCLVWCLSSGLQR